MRALDTNVLVRALVHDDPVQGRRAEVCLNAQPVYVPVTVILELESIASDRIHSKISWLGLVGDGSVGAISVSN